MRRPEVSAGLRDDACRAVGSVPAAAVERLLEAMDEEDSDTAGRDIAAELLDIEELARRVPIALAVDLLEAVGVFLGQREARSGTEINADAELRINGLSAGKDCVERHAGQRQAAKMQRNRVRELGSRLGHAKGRSCEPADDPSGVKPAWFWNATTAFRVSGPKTPSLLRFGLGTSCRLSSVCRVFTWDPCCLGLNWPLSHLVSLAWENFVGNIERRRKYALPNSIIVWPAEKFAYQANLY